MSEQQYCYLKTILHSYQLTQINQLKLFIDNQQKSALLLAKSNSIQFCILENNQPVDSFQIKLNCNILKIQIIPSKYPRSDIIFVLDNKNRFIMFRIDNNRKVQLLAKQLNLIQYTKILKKQSIFSGIDYHYNVNDTEGFIFYCVGETILLINFIQKLEGLKIISYPTHNFSTKIKYINTIPKNYSKFKTSYFGVITNQDDKCHFRINNTNFTQQDFLNIDKINLINFYAGKQLILLASKEVFIYNYNSNKPLITYRIPIINSINQVIYLQQVYCMLGNQLIIFNIQGIKNYGDFTSRSAKHIGGNRILVQHEDQDALLIQLEDDKVKQIKRWLNLGNIFSVETIQDSGQQIYVIVSPNKKKQISIFTKSIGIKPLIAEQFDQPINKIQKIQINPSTIYVLANFFDQCFYIMKVTQIGLQQICVMDSKLIFAHNKYLVLQTGVYQITYQPKTVIEIVQDLNINGSTQNKILRAQIQNNMLAYESNTMTLHIFNLDNFKSHFVHLQNPLSALTVYEGIIYYSQWSSKKLVCLKDTYSLEIKIEKNIRCMKCMKGHLFVGYSGGKVEIYAIQKDLILIKKYQFFGGTYPIKFQQVDGIMYCLSNKCSIVTINRTRIEKKILGIRNLTGIVSAPQNKFIISLGKTLAIVDIKKQEQIINYDVEVTETDIPFVKIFNKQIYVFTPKLLEVYDAFSQQKKSFTHQLSEVDCIQKNNEGLLVGGIIQKNNSLVYFKNYNQVGRLFLKKKPKLIRWIQDNKFGIIFLNEFKIVKILENKIIQLLSTQIQMDPYSLDIQPNQNKLIILDPVKSMVLYDYNLNTHKITPLSRFACDRISNQVSFLGQYIIQTDKSSNIFITEPQLNAISDLEKMNLRLKGGMNLGQQIWAVNRNKKILTYGTSSGSIGKIYLIKKQEFEVLKQIQKILIQESNKSGFKYEQWKQIKVSHMPKIDMRNNCLVDGDQFSEFSLYNQQQLIQIFGKSTKKQITSKTILNILEQIQKRAYQINQ